MCWAYEDPGVLRQRTVEFLTDGVLQGQRIIYADARSAVEQCKQLEGLYDIDGLLARGALRLQVLGEAVIDPSAQVASFAVATKRALAAGYTGLRMAADVTPLVRTSVQRAAFARYEHQLDRFMVNEPFTALCAFDARYLAPEAVAELACLHPLVNVDVAPFRLFASSARTAAFKGDVDALSAPLFSLTIARVADTWEGHSMVVEVDESSFIDHRFLLVIQHMAEHAGLRAIVIRQRSPMTTLLAGYVDIPRVKVEQTA
jgi:hypothetical protein